jgi:hypothetical protein
MTTRQSVAVAGGKVKFLQGRGGEWDAGCGVWGVVLA